MTDEAHSYSGGPLRAIHVVRETEMWVVGESEFVHDELAYGYHDNGAIVRWTP